MDRCRRGVLRGDDQPSPRTARRPGRDRPLLDAYGRARGSGQRRHDQGAHAYNRRPSPGSGPHALPRRPPVALRIVAIRLPADLRLLRHRADEVRPQPIGVGDPRSGASLPTHHRGRPLRVHGHGRAADEPRQRAGGMPPAAGRGHHPSAHGDLHRRMDSGDRSADRRPDAAAPGVVPARRQPGAALGADAGQRPLSPERGAQRMSAVLRAQTTNGVRRVRDAGRHQRLGGPGARAGGCAWIRRSTRST